MDGILKKLKTRFQDLHDLFYETITNYKHGKQRAQQARRYRCLAAAVLVVSIVIIVIERALLSWLHLLKDVGTVFIAPFLILIAASIFFIFVLTLRLSSIEGTVLILQRYACPSCMNNFRYDPKYITARFFDPYTIQKKIHNGAEIVYEETYWCHVSADIVCPLCGHAWTKSDSVVKTKLVKDGKTVYSYTNENAYQRSWDFVGF